MTVEAVPVVTVVGRLVDAATGEPLSGIGPWAPGAPSDYPGRGPAVKMFLQAADPDQLDGYRGGRGWTSISGGSPRAGVHHAATDADGRFTLRIPAHRARGRRVRVIGSDILGVRLPAVADLPAAAVGETLDAGDLPLAPVPEIAGTVVDAAGAPVAGAVVTDGARGTPAYGLMLKEVRTDDAGRFRVPPRQGQRLPDPDGDGGVTIELLACDPAGNREGTAAITVRAGKDVPPVRLVLADAPPASPRCHAEGQGRIDRAD